MVAGGVQSVEEGAFYATTHQSYYPQFYSTLLPPQQPAGSYTSSNYSGDSSTYSSSAQSSECSWLRMEGSGGRHSPPAGGKRHPKCTCPSPEAVRVARRALAARRARLTSKDPRCTCPSPSSSQEPSLTSGSPPSSPNIGSSPVRHPRCTCPSDAPEICTPKAPRHPRCTCLPSPSASPSVRSPTCTCPPGKKAPDGKPCSTKGRLVHAVLLKYPGSTAISTDHGDFMKLSDSSDKISSYASIRKKGSSKKNKTKAKLVSDGEGEIEKENMEEILDASSSAPSSAPSSPARRMKERLKNLRHKVVTEMANLASRSSTPVPSEENKENEDDVCPNSSDTEVQDIPYQNPLPGQVTRILPVSPPKVPINQHIDYTTLDMKRNSRSFPLEDIPQPILEDLTSPLGAVPPLSPDSRPITPTIRENLMHHPLTRHLLGLGSDVSLPSCSNSPSRERVRSFSTSSKDLRHIQPLSKSQLTLESTEELESLIRTQSLDLFSKDAAQYKRGNGRLVSAGSLSNKQTKVRRRPVPAASVKSLNRPSSSNRAESMLNFSSPCISSVDMSCFTMNSKEDNQDVTTSEEQNSLLQKLKIHNPNYENVVFHDSGGYIMLSKKLLDQWQLSYEACLPPDVVLENINSRVLPGSSKTEREQPQPSTSCPQVDPNHVALSSPHSRIPASKQLPYSPKPYLPHTNSSTPPTPQTPSFSQSQYVTSASPSPLRGPSPAGSSSSPGSTRLQNLAAQHVGGLVQEVELLINKSPPTNPRTRRKYSNSSNSSRRSSVRSVLENQMTESSKNQQKDEGDTDQETDRLLGQQRSDDPGFYEEKEKETTKKKGRSKEVLIEGVLFRARYLGSTQLVSEGQPTKTTRMMQAEEAVSRIKALAPDGEAQPSTEVDLFISTEKIMVLNTDLKEIMMDHALRTISYIADIGDLVVLMARRRILPTDDGTAIAKTPKMICHVFESDEAQFIAQSIGQAFQVAYLEFLKANGIEDHSFVKEMDYQEVLNSQEIFGDELQMFAKKELQKEVVVPKMKAEILGVVVVESGWGSMVPTVVIANLSPIGAAAKCGQLNIGDQIIAINGVSLVGLPLSTCQNYIKNTKYNTAVKLTVVPCPPVVEVKIRRPDTKYQLGFSVQNGVICSLLRGGIAERGGVRVGHRIIDINSQSVVAVPHEKIVNLLATSVGEIRMKTMPTSIFRLLTGQETPQYI